MIKRFERTYGYDARMIMGQSRYLYALSSTEDFYDMEGWLERGGYKGSVIIFFDIGNGKVYEPFSIRKNVLYSEPVFFDGSIWFLRGDFDQGMITLVRYLPGDEPEPIVRLKTDGVDLYNLKLMGEGINITSQNGELFRCYYPENFSFAIGPRMSVQLIKEDLVYISEWHEEGWDDKNNCAGDDYSFYEKVIIKDRKGNTLSCEKGSLCQTPDGIWLIS